MTSVAANRAVADDSTYWLSHPSRRAIRHGSPGPWRCAMWPGGIEASPSIELFRAMA